MTINTPATRDAVARVRPALGPAVAELAGIVDSFAAAGRELALVGGSVRDAALGRTDSDLDLTTDAPPEQIVELVAPHADALWDTGIRFGTVGIRRAGYQVEITTYRAEHYAPDSRKPEVVFGTDLLEDLARRDFTINAMAVRLPTGAFEDPHGGMLDLVEGTIRTPAAPQDSFADDPLRMMRAARFVSQLGFEIEPATYAAMTESAERIAIVSAERVRDELVKLMLGRYPSAGIRVLVDTGLADFVLPEVPALSLEIDEHRRHKDVYEHSLTVLDQAIALESAHEPAVPPDFVLRFAALMHDIGKPRTRRFTSDGVSFHHHEVVGAKMTRKRMKALRFPNDVTDDVSRLVELHLRFHGYGSGEWTDAAVRRYVRDAGSQLTRLHKLTRADSTTRNRRKAAALQATYDDLERRIERLAEQEELQALRPELDGKQIMAILGIPPGPQVGEAYRHLLEFRIENGILGEEAVTAELRRWWDER
ncbi:MAG: CCA tRNA nucleotidyltransferase [Actinobacteria bacterium]|nr:CCA tRNA nucleotidyltransferase [Actinomycetota bacterium]MCB9411557.1 CCA tRNA nucleotidyltransferase [Actinomycetota bacterium]